MSQSPKQGEKRAVPDYARRSHELSRMLSEGRSFSGHERHCAFLNLGNEANNAGARFATVSAVAGLDFIEDGRAIAVLDWDRDGDLDLWIRNRNAPQLRLMRNEGGANAGGFLRLRLIGDGVTTNRDAIGARVEVFLNGQGEERLVRTVRAGDGFLSQSSRWLHFGLGPDPGEIERVEVRWPSDPSKEGAVQHLTGLDVNRSYLVEQGAETPDPWEPPEIEGDALKGLPIEMPAEESAIRISATSRVPMGVLKYRDLEANPVMRHPDPSRGRWTLVNLWASWCAPCQAELREFATRAEEVAAAKIDVYALSVEELDGVTPGSPILPQVKKLLETTGFTSAGTHFQAGFVERDLVTELQEMNRALTGIHRDLPVPSSFLLNPEGLIVALYKGIVPVDKLLDDASKADRPLTERVQRAFELGGSFIPSEAIRKAERIREAVYQYEVARTIFPKARDGAVAYADESLRYQPDRVATRLLRGTALNDLGKLEDAAEDLNWVLSALFAENQQRAEAAYQLFIIAMKQQSLDEGLQHLETTLRYKGNYDLALNNLAFLLASNVDPAKRDLPRAIKLAERVVGLTREQNPNYLDTLATVYGMSGRFEEGLQAIDKALPLAEAADKRELIAKLLVKQAAYREARLP